MKTLRIPLALSACVTLSGCLSLLIEDGAISDVKSAKAEHHYGFHVAQAMKMVDLGQCVVAADYFEEQTDGTMKSYVDSELLESYVARSAEDSERIATRCEEEVVPALDAASRYDDLQKLYVALSELPLSEERAEAFVYASKTTKLLEARKLSEQAQARWDAGAWAEAIALFDRARSAANSVRSVAKPEELATYERLYAEHVAERVNALVEQAGKLERTPSKRHVAILYYARAHRLSRNERVLARVKALEETILDETPYDYRFSVTGDSTVARAAKSGVSKNQPSGNLRVGEGEALKIEVTLGKPSFSLDKKNVRLSGSYADGTELVMNPKYKQASTYMARMERCRNGGFSYERSRECRFSGGGDGAVDSNRREYERAANVLRQTPQQIQETSYSTHRYEAVEHTWSLTVPMRQVITRQGERKTYDEKVVVTHTDHTHGSVPVLKLSPRTARGLGNAKMLENAGAKLAGLAVAYIKKDYAGWLAGFPGRGVEGKVVYILMNDRGSKELDDAIMGATGIPDASSILNAR